MKKLFFLPALAAMMFSSCSSDEPTVDPSVDQNGDKYMAFSITNLGGSRAEDETIFEDAAGTEGDIEAANLYFLFFDRNGNAFMLEGRSVSGKVELTNMVKPTSVIAQKPNAAGNETLNGTLVLGKPGAPFLGQEPAQVLCVANPSTTAMAKLDGKNLSAVLEVVTSAPDWANGKFLMTNATFVKGSGDAAAVETATSTAGHIGKTVAEAEGKPVIINLERAAAKVRVAYDPDYTVNNIDTDPSTTKFMVDGAETELHVQVYGWRLMNYATSGYGFKQLSSSYTFNPAWTWNDENKGRSYWAKSLASATISHPHSATTPNYDLYAEGADDNFTLKSFVSGVTNVAYCYENTLHQDAATNNRTIGATAFVVKAIVGTMNGTTFAPIDMVKYAGKLYTVAHFKEMILNQFKSGEPDATAANTTVNFVVDDASKNTWKATVTYNGHDNDMSYIYNNFLWWQDGVTSYWMNIQHFGGLTGVVRNHIYDYNIEAFNGLGIPGNVPEIPTDKESYMAAALRVLNWHVVKHDVTLE